MTRLTRISATQARARAAKIDDNIARGAADIIDEVRQEGDAALLRWAERFDELRDGQLLLGRDALERALSTLDDDTRQLLERTADRIRQFAEAQRASLAEINVPIPGGRAGHSIAPIEQVACYAPGGLYPLPSSVLMTVIPARVAGCSRVCLATPAPSDLMLAAAAIADVDSVLCAGGAHAIAALAYGTQRVAPVDLIAGPGNAWVTAAKRLVMGQVGIDALAGPSELLIVADAAADADVIAADLLAQAEHDPAAVPMLLITCAETASRVDDALETRLANLATATIARVAIANGFCVLCADIDEAIKLSDAIAPEHLQLVTSDAADIAPRFKHYGGLFIGDRSAEVLGDYGAGPNHVLPTSRTARFSGGLSVLSFLRVRTWIAIDDTTAAEALGRDVARLARLEGLEAHAQAAECRLPRPHAAE
jgi:phosphoribosyl-ATP pyrophosphohydrolase/phosphoribosyl-AMP cyclohydrolase/histidinol dehydrogenase